MHLQITVKCQASTQQSECLVGRCIPLNCIFLSQLSELYDMEMGEKQQNRSLRMQWSDFDVDRDRTGFVFI